MTVTGSLIDTQLARLIEAYPSATTSALPDGTTLVTVPGVVLPAGWNEQTTVVSFVIPIGYPMARPDCFWAEERLRLAGGAMPQNAGVNTIPGTTNPQLWFSWHLGAWNPASDSLITYLRVIVRRFVELR